MLNEVIELRRIWLDEDTPVQTLADAIGLERSNLNRLLNDPSRRPQPRTLRKIQTFLERRREASKASSSRRRSR